MNPRAALFAALLLASFAALAANIFLQERSPASGRYAILEDDGKTAFLYLTEPNALKPIRDAVVYSRVAPVSKVDWERIKTTGDTPQLPADLAGPSAVILSPKASRFKLKWSRDGQSVAVLLDGSPMAMATMNEKIGYSKAVKKDSPLGRVWDQQRYQALFVK